MLVSDVISSVRTNLQDTVETYRWSDAELLSYYNAGILDIFKKRPDSRLDSNGDLIVFAEATATTDTALLNSSWKPALEFYIIYRAFDKDSDETMDTNRSASHFQLYMKELA